jgi:hypothetical protein
MSHTKALTKGTLLTLAWSLNTHLSVLFPA